MRSFRHIVFAALWLLSNLHRVIVTPAMRCNFTRCLRVLGEMHSPDDQLLGPAPTSAKLCSEGVVSMLRSDSNAEASKGPGSAIGEGCEVIVFHSRDDMKAVVVRGTSKYDCKFGCFKMSDWIGRPYGSQVQAVGGKGFVYLLSPTPELWTQVLRHRTQILYVADISMITCFLELRPGMTVLESGTGSGSLTHSLARAIAPGGKVFTYEFHAERMTEARKEFQSHGLDKAISIAQRDIEAHGFPEEHHGKADAVFLDLPGPWKVVDSAANCLKPDGRLCTFSPCIEQVQRTCGAMTKCGFYHLRTMECLLRQYDIKTMSYVSDVYAPSPLTTRQKRRRDGEEKQNIRIADGPSAYEAKYLQAKPSTSARGHTGYLTFARRIVNADAPISECPEILDEEEDVQ